jgi:sulfate adenylyltransferase subunit 1 (EFTu-like GTPase family)
VVRVISARELCSEMLAADLASVSNTLSTWDSRLSALEHRGSECPSLQRYRNVHTLHRDEETKELGLNKIGLVQASHDRPAALRALQREPQPGSFILIDEATGSRSARG